MCVVHCYVVCILIFRTAKNPESKTKLDKTTVTESASPVALYAVVAGGDAPPPTAPPPEVVPPPPHPIKRNNVPDEITALERILEFSNVSTPSATIK